MPLNTLDMLKPNKSANKEDDENHYAHADTTAETTETLRC